MAGALLSCGLACISAVVALLILWFAVTTFLHSGELGSQRTGSDVADVDSQHALSVVWPLIADMLGLVLLAAGIALGWLVAWWSYHSARRTMMQEHRCAYTSALGILVTSDLAIFVLDAELFGRIQASHSLALPIKLAKRKQFPLPERVHFAAELFDQFCAAAGRQPDSMSLDPEQDIGLPGLNAVNGTSLALCDFLLGQADPELLQGWVYPMWFDWPKVPGWQMPNADFLAELPDTGLR